MTTVNNEGTGALVIVKATMGATDTILYSQHDKIGSHNGQGEVDYYQTSQTQVAQQRLQPFWFWQTFRACLTEKISKRKATKVNSVYVIFGQSNWLNK